MDKVEWRLREAHALLTHALKEARANHITQARICLERALEIIDQVTEATRT